MFFYNFDETCEPFVSVDVAIKKHNIFHLMNTVFLDFAFYSIGPKPVRFIINWGRACAGNAE